MTNLQPFTDRLVQIEKAKKALAAAGSIAEVKTIRDKAEVIRLLMKQQSGCLDSQNAAAELKLRAERKLGNFLGETAHSGRPLKKSHHGTVLPDGINKNQSIRWQREAKVSEDRFENYLDSQRERCEEITSVGLLRLGQAGMQGHNSIGRNWYTPKLYIEKTKTIKRVCLNREFSDSARDASPSGGLTFGLLCSRLISGGLATFRVLDSRPPRCRD